MNMRPFRSVVLLAAFGAVLPGSAQVARSEGTVAQKSSPESPGMDKINHVVWIIQENRSFDNYFGTYPGADGFPPTTCLPKMPGSKDCVAPFHMPAGAPTCDLDHSWRIAHAAINNGRMDGFVWAEGSPYTMGYYDERDIPNYWKYAHQYALADRFFSSLNGPSLPNHIYTVAAQSGGITDNYLSLEDLEEDTDSPEGLTFPTIVDLMDKAKVSWKYYVEGTKKPPFHLWNPLPGFKDVRENPERMSKIVGSGRVFSRSATRHPSPGFVSHSQRPGQRAPHRIPHPRHVVRDQTSECADEEPLLERQCRLPHLGRLRRLL